MGLLIPSSQHPHSECFEIPFEGYSQNLTATSVKRTKELSCWPLPIQEMRGHLQLHCSKHYLAYLGNRTCVRAATSLCTACVCPLEAFRGVTHHAVRMHPPAVLI